MKGSASLTFKNWILPALALGLLAGCDMRMPDVGSMMPSFGSATPYADPMTPVAAIPRGPDPLAEFAASANPGSVGTVNGERVRLARAYNAASGRECREVIMGSGSSERAAVACREADGSFVSSRPLLRGGLR